MKIEDLLLKLARDGGVIVSSGVCTTFEITQAQASDRFAIVDSFGFVLRPKIWGEVHRRIIHEAQDMLTAALDRGESPGLHSTAHAVRDNLRTALANLPVP